MFKLSQHRQLFCIVAGLAVLTAAQAVRAGGAAATQPALPKSIDAVNCPDTGQPLASGPSVFCVPAEHGGFNIRIASPSCSYKRFLVYAGGFYGLPAVPGVVMIRDESSADQDVLLVVNLAGPSPDVVEVGHPDGQDYGHCQYVKPTIGARGVTFTETMWAGDSGTRPRSRIVVIGLDAPMGVRIVGPWREGD